MTDFGAPRLTKQGILALEGTMGASMTERLQDERKERHQHARQQLGKCLKRASMPEGFRTRSMWERSHRPASDALAHRHSDGSAIKGVLGIGAVSALLLVSGKFTYEALTLPEQSKPNPIVAGEILKAHNPHLQVLTWTTRTGKSSHHHYAQSVLAITDNLSRNLYFPLGPAVDQHEHQYNFGYSESHAIDMSTLKSGTLFQVLEVENFSSSAGTRITRVLPVQPPSSHPSTNVGLATFASVVKSEAQY